MNIETTKVLEIIELSSVKYNVQNFGLRFLPKGDEVKVGQVLKTSFEQVDDQDEYELDGVSTIGLNYDGYDLCDFDKSLDSMEQYNKGGSLVMVACEDGNCAYGNDQDEVIMTDAVVVHIFN